MAKDEKKEEKKDGKAEGAEASPDDAAKSKKKKLLIFIIAGVLLTAALGGGAAFLLAGGKKDAGEEVKADAHGEKKDEHGKEEHGKEGEKKEEHGKEGEKKEEHGKEGEKKEEHGKEGEKKEEHGKEGAKDDKKPAKKDIAGFGCTLAFTPPFNVNLRNALGSHYMRLEIAVEYPCSDEDAKEELTQRMPQLRDAVISVASNKSREFLLGPDGMDTLRRDLQNRINQFMSRKIKSVYITDILVE